MTDYSYSYDWDEQYCYPHSNVLKNKLDITDSDKLVNAERELTSLKLAVAKLNYIKGRFDFDHLRRIHIYLFGDIYTWAGKIRTVDIAKGNQFCLCYNIESYANIIFQKLKQENFLIDSNNAPIRLAYYLSEINVLHPFREGNGRTQRLFIEYLANVAGYEVDFSDVTAHEMIVASAESFACNYDKINALFERITNPISEEDQRAAISVFFGSRSQQMKLFEDINEENQFTPLL